MRVALFQEVVHGGVLAERINTVSGKQWFWAGTQANANITNQTTINTQSKPGHAKLPNVGHHNIVIEFLLPVGRWVERFWIDSEYHDLVW